MKEYYSGDIGSAETKKTYPSTFVAFLDILGFEDIVLSLSHEQLESFYENTFFGTAAHSLSNNKHVLLQIGEFKILGPDIRQASVNSLIMSDSICLWSNDDSAASFHSIIFAVRNLLAFSMINRVILRAAIAIGPLTLYLNEWPSHTHSFQHSLIGKAIIEVVRGEKQQEWCGSLISSAAIESYKNSCPVGESLIESKIVVFYPVPIKDKDEKYKEVGRYVIDWVNHPGANISTETVAGSFTPPQKPDSKKWEKIERRANNTLKFVKAMKP